MPSYPLTTPQQVYGSAPGLTLAALIFAILGAIAAAILGVFLTVVGVLAFSFIADASLFFWGTFFFISLGINIWVAARSAHIRRALRYQDTLAAARLNSVSLGALALVFGSVLSGIFLLVARGGIQRALKAQEPSLEALAPTPAVGIGAATRDLGRLLLVLFGIALVLAVSSSYVFELLRFLISDPFFPVIEVTSLSVRLVGGALLITVGASMMRAAGNISRGESVRTSALIAVIAFAAFLAAIGVDFLLPSPVGPPSELTAYLIFAAAALIIAGSALYVAEGSTVKIAGGVLGITAVGLLFTVEMRDSLAQTLAGDFVVLAGYLVVGIAAVLFPFLRRTRADGVPGIVAAVGLATFGVGVTVQSLVLFGDLLFALTGQLGATIFVVPFLLSAFGRFFFTISGLLIIGASGVAIAFLAKGMVARARPAVPPALGPETYAPPAVPEPGLPGTPAPGGVTPSATPAAPAQGAAVPQEDWMVRLMQQIGDLEQEIQEQQDFLFRLDEALVEGRVERGTYQRIKEPRLERITEMQDRLTDMRRHLPEEGSGGL